MTMSYSALSDYVITTINEITKKDISTDPSFLKSPLSDFGLDSLDVTELLIKYEAKFKIVFPNDYARYSDVSPESIIDLIAKKKNIEKKQPQITFNPQQTQSTPVKTALDNTNQKKEITGKFYPFFIETNTIYPRVIFNNKYIDNGFFCVNISQKQNTRG